MKTIFTLILGWFCIQVSIGQSDIASLEYFIDTDPGVGNAIVIDIDPDAESIDQSFSISTSGLSEGTHRLFIRAINIDGTASLFEHKTFRIAPTQDHNTNDIVEAEYFLNTDPGIGNGTVIDIPDGSDFDGSLTIVTTGIPEGTHRLFIRVKNSANQWSLFEHRSIRIAPTQDTNDDDVVSVEYFFDTDPGVGNATELAITPGSNIDDVISIPTSSLTAGTYRLFIRAKNADDSWSLYEHKTFRVSPSQDVNTATIQAAEYFVDIDPGVGNANAITLSGDNLDEALNIPTLNSLSDGTHLLHIRVQNADGSWSLYETQEFETTGTLAVDENILTQTLLYPNPVADYLNITLSNDIALNSIKIIDFSGKIVFTSSKEMANINLSFLRAGMYLIHLETDKGILSKKIIKK